MVAKSVSIINYTVNIRLFHFSSFLKFKMPEVPYDGNWGEKMTPKIFLEYEVILIWSTAFEDFRGRNFDIVMYFCKRSS